MANFKEFFLGSSEEKSARSKTKNYKDSPPTNNRQRKDAENAERISRRLLLRQTAAGAGAILLAGAAAGEEIYRRKQEAGYKGPVKDIEGLPYIDEEKLHQILDALAKSSNSLMQKVANDLQYLHESTDNPPEFPYWLIDERTTPFPIVTREGTLSETVIQAPLDNSDTFFLRTPGLPQGGVQHYRQPSMSAIILSSQEQLAPFGPLAQGLPLLKEHITNMLHNSVGMDFYDFLQQTGLGEITDIDGGILPNRIDQLRAGYTVAFNDLSDPKTDFAKLIDGYPIFIMNATINQLIDSGELPPIIQNFGGGNLVATYLNIPDVDTNIQNFTSTWTRENTLFTPMGSVYSMTQEPVARAIISFQNTIHPDLV